MERSSDRLAATERGRWLAELAHAIAEGQRVARSLGVSRGNCAETEVLYVRLEMVGIEVEKLRRGGWSAQSIIFDPQWTSLFPLQGRPEF